MGQSALTKTLPSSRAYPTCALHIWGFQTPLTRLSDGKCCRLRRSFGPFLTCTAGNEPTFLSIILAAPIGFSPRWQDKVQRAPLSANGLVHWTLTGSEACRYVLWIVRLSVVSLQVSNQASALVNDTTDCASHQLTGTRPASLLALLPQVHVCLPNLFPFPSGDGGGAAQRHFTVA